MHRYPVIAMLAAAAACSVGVTLAGAEEQQRSEAVDATAAVEVVGGTRQIIVHLRNNATAPLEAWYVRIQYAPRDGTPRSEDHGVDTSSDEAEPGTPGHGSIPPGESRDMRLYLEAEPFNVSVSIIMLVFDDGTVQGSTGLAKTVFAVRERRAEPLTIWIDALSAASMRSVPEARKRLEETLASEERHMRTSPGYDGQAAYETIEWLLAASDNEMMTRIAATKQRFERVRQREMRHTSR